MKKFFQVFIFAAVKTVLIHPGQIDAQVTVVIPHQNPPAAVLKCPTNLTLCVCHVIYYRGPLIDCSSPVNTPGVPDDITREFEVEVTAIKEESQEDGATGLIPLNVFSLSPRNLQKLELRLLDGFSITAFEISSKSSHSSELKEIVGGLDQVGVFPNVESVTIESNPKLDDKGLGETLKAFSSSTQLFHLDLRENSLTGSNDDDEGSEFLPGFSSLVSLENLLLRGNKITRIFTAHFKHLLRLEYLDLSENKIVSVKGSLFFVQNNLNELAVDLNSNFIYDISALHVYNSSTANLTNNKKLVSLEFRNNRLSKLPFEIFYDFLRSNQDNSIDLWGNPLACDRNVKWLTESEDNRFSRQITGAKCSNLQGAPLFKEDQSDVCPEPGQITPCTCQEKIRRGYGTLEINIKCEGESIVQENIDNAIQILKLVTRLTQNQMLEIYTFSIAETLMTELDLSSFFGVKIQVFSVSWNKLLTKFTHPRMIPGISHVVRLRVEQNPKLDDEGLGDTLKLFSDAMQDLVMYGTSLRGHFKVESDSRVEKMEREFLPGLARLFKLTFCALTDNKIEHLGVGRFRNNSKLEYLWLRNNSISTLQKNVFLFNDNSKHRDAQIQVDLSMNALSENSLPLNVFGSTRAILEIEPDVHFSAIHLFPPQFFTPTLTPGAELSTLSEEEYSNEFESTFRPDAGENLAFCCLQTDSEIICAGEKVTEDSLQTVFETLNFEIGEQNKSQIVLGKLKIVNTSITELDLSPLINFEISTLLIFGNSNLSNITGKKNSNSSIVVKELIIESNPNLDDFGIENLLTFFEPQDIESLSLAQNSLSLKSTLEGLSTLENLKVLDLRANKIRRLSSNFFHGVINRRLEHLDLSENRIEKIDHDAFGFSPNEKSSKISVLLNINLNFNPITENSFPWNATGLEKLERPIQLNFVHNKMTTLPFAPFSSLLNRENGDFRIDLYGNPLDCDWRLNWLDKTSVLNSSSTVFIENAECTNQPRKFIQNFKKSVTRDFCSEMKDLAPCSCFSSSNSLECVGDQIDDEGLKDVFSKIRRLDPFCSEQFPQMDKIVFRSTKLTLLDLTDFFDVCLTNLTSLVVDSNLNLTRIFGPPLADSSSLGQSIKVQHLEITSNPLTDDGFGSTLKYFGPKMETLKLNGNQLKGNGDIEFLPGLSSLKHLTRIELNSNQFSRLPTALFEINSIHDNSALVIDLTSNFLADDSFDAKLFVEKMSRPLNLILSRNRFTTIPGVPFQNFLEANSANQLNFRNNFLKCDGKLDWINNRKEEFNRFRILNAECEGDSIFNSKYFNTLVSDDGILTIVLSVVIPTILILVLFAVVIWRKFRRVQDRLLYLSTKDIDEFRKGNSNLKPNDLHAAIMSRPFDENLEIPREALEYEEGNVLGSGQYGIVFKGVFKGMAGNVCVALKTVTTSADLDTFKSLLSEIKILVFVGSHQNIVQLLGASTANIRKRDVLAVLEFCQNGDLRSYLLGQKTNFQDAIVKYSQESTFPVDEPVVELQHTYQNFLTTVHLLKFAMGIANGLKYLRTKNVIHGDLAARNILLTDKLEAKISDFGLSRQLTNYQNYLKSTICALPFKWMSIEAIKDMNFSVCSDIWSFGVVLFEIFSMGEIPYPGLAVDHEFLPRLLQGYRMEKPKCANHQIYELMLDTWKMEPLDRPSSDEILCRLNQILGLVNSGTKSNSYV